MPPPPFPLLFTPLHLGKVEIRNRILSTGQQTFLARDGIPGEDLIAYLRHATSGEPIIREGVDTVVLATGHAAQTALEKALEGVSCPVNLVGDCLAPRSAEEAIYEGFLASREV